MTLRAVITDLDNTLYDWVAYFIPAFRAMIKALVELTGVPETRLLDDTQGLEEIFFGLTGEADDDVGGDGRIGHALAHPLEDA